MWKAFKGDRKINPQLNTGLSSEKLIVVLLPISL